MSARRFRVALIITELDVGGAERCLVHLACKLDRERFDTVVYALGRRPAEDQLAQQLERAGVPLRFVGASSVWSAVSAQRRLFRWLKQQRPDIVQTFLFHANVLGTLAAVRAGVPLCIWGVRVADPSKWRLRLERLMSGFAQRIVCVSQDVANFMLRHGFAPEKLAVIPNGVAVDQFPSAEAIDTTRLGIPPGRKIILYVGRLDYQKGLDWLIELVPQISNELPEHDLLFVGEGPQRQELQRRAQQLGVRHRVHFAGWRGDVASILRSSELLVLPSRWEGMPNVVLEAMASRLPLVTTRADGIQEILGPLKASQMAEMTNQQEFVSKVVAICRDPSLAQHLAAANRERVERCFSLQKAIHAYQALYEALIDR